jgi:hypothetical protein
MTEAELDDTPTKVTVILPRWAVDGLDFVKKQELTGSRGLAIARLVRAYVAPFEEKPSPTSQGAP